MFAQRTAVKLAIGITAALAAVIAIVLRPERKIAEVSATPRVQVLRNAVDHLAAGAPLAVASLRSVPPSTNYRKAFAESHDYWAFAQIVFLEAQAGDVNAQFFLSKALSFCAQTNDAYFQLNGKPLTLDEALQYGASMKLSMELVQSMYERCHAFREHDATTLGKASDWLEKATEGGQPAAQATTAAEMLQQQLMINFLKAGAAQTPTNTAPLIGNGADPVELIRAAVQSRDPEALLNIGWAQALLHPGQDANTEYLAWMMVACERGIDCSANADWLRTHCSYCDTSTPVNLVRSRAGDAWPKVQERVQEINAKLDAGQWNELGLGS